MNRIRTGTGRKSSSMLGASISAEMHTTRGFKEPPTGNATIIINDTILTEA